MEEDVPIEHGLINRAIENAQKKVEGHNFDIRKNLLEYDDVMNQQRKTIYALRRQVLEGRYAPEPTDEEKKRRRTAASPGPTPRCRPSRASTRSPASSSMVRPILARMCDALCGVARRRSRGARRFHRHDRAGRTRPTSARSSTASAGAYLDTKGIVEDRTATLDRLAGEVASSMIQQRERLLDLSEEMIQSIVDEHCPPNSHAEDWDLEVLRTAVKQRFNFEPDDRRDRGDSSARRWPSRSGAEVEKVIEARETEFPLPVLLHYARLFYLEEIDERWIEHLKSMEALREGIHLRGYGQKDPKQEYKKEGFVIFGEMMDNIGRNVCEKLFHMQLQRADAPAPAPAGAPRRPSRRPPCR